MIDVQWPGDVPVVAPAVEAAGYRRYWATEHHSPTQSGSPTMVAAVAGQVTSRIRVGTAGVLLPYTSPLKVAEDARLLEVWFPGRVDIGVTTGTTPEPWRSALLDGRDEPDAAGYEERVEQVARLLRRHGDRAAGPDSGDRAVPPLWVCGMSARSAALAGRLGCHFAYSEHIRRNHRVDEREARTAIAAYRSSFRPAADSPRDQSPFVAVVCYGACASSEREAGRWWASHYEPPRHPLTPTFLGPPERCCEELDEVQRRLGADELIVQTIVDDVDDRIASYRLLAEAMGLVRMARAGG